MKALKAKAGEQQSAIDDLQQKVMRLEASGAEEKEASSSMMTGVQEQFKQQLEEAAKAIEKAEDEKKKLK